MSWWKEKKHPRLRRCNVCQNIYETEYKLSGKRTACPECHKHLNKLGTNVEEYLKMEEPKEIFEWTAENEIRATFENNKDTKENGKIKRIRRNSTVEMTNRKEMEEGIKNIKESIERNKEQIKIFKKQLDSVGKIPNKSNEIIRFERNMTDLAKIAKAGEINQKIDPLEKEIEANEKILIKRKEFLKTKWET